MRAPGEEDGAGARERLWGTLALLAAALSFSTGGAAIKLADLDPWAIASARSGVAALLLVPLAWRARRARGKRARSTLASPRVVLTACAYAGTMLLFVLANRTTTAAGTVFLQGTAPLFLVFLAPLLLHEQPRRADFVTLVFLLAGLLLTVFDVGAPQATAPDPRGGNLLALGAGLTWALTLLGLRAMARAGEPPVAAVAAGSVFALLLAAPRGWPSLSPGAVDTVDAAVLLWLGLVQIGLAYVLVGYGLARLPALEGSLLLLLEPVANPVWTWLVHRERPGAATLAGGACILAGTVLRALLERWAARERRRAADGTCLRDGS